MGLLQEVLNAQNGGSVRNLAQSFGLREEQVAAALNQLVPALASGLHHNTQSPDGLSSLASALDTGNHQRYADDPATLTRPETVDDGNGILGHLFGSKDTSREVAARAATRSGVSADILKRMLPVVAAMVMGQLSRRAGAARQAPAAGGPGGLGGLGGLGGMLGSMLDADRDGSVVDDLLGKMMRR